MKRLCDWFDRNRDGMLNPAQQRQFESHIPDCPKCRSRSLLLDNLVLVIQKQELPAIPDTADKIADRAYEQSGHWDVLFLSWLRPGPAWSSFAALVILLSFLWALPSFWPLSDYDAILMQGDPASLAGNTLTNLTDDELELWLEQGGAAK
jgi:hypothetical protein